MDRHRLRKAHGLIADDHLRRAESHKAADPARAFDEGVCGRLIAYAKLGLLLERSAVSFKIPALVRRSRYGAVLAQEDLLALGERNAYLLREPERANIVFDFDTLLDT